MISESTEPGLMEILSIMVNEYFLPLWFFIIFFCMFIYHDLVPEPKKKRKKY
jgi:hypothetical protein